MASTQTDSVIWVVGETVGVDGETGGTAAVPQGPVFFATNTTVPTAAPFGHTEHVTSGGDRYLWDGDSWVGPYTT